jgi:hypothetical protein
MAMKFVPSKRQNGRKNGTRQTTTRKRKKNKKTA